MALGDIDQRIDYSARNEMGALADCFRQLIDYIQGIAGAAEVLQRNDRTFTVVPRSEHDRLSKNFMSINGVKQINRAVAQLNQVTQHTAATSEETASAVAQLTSQATDMQALVHTFHLSQTEQVEALVSLEPQPAYPERTCVGV